MSLPNSRIRKRILDASTLRRWKTDNWTLFTELETFWRIWPTLLIYFIRYTLPVLSVTSEKSILGRPSVLCEHLNRNREEKGNPIIWHPRKYPSLHVSTVRKHVLQDRGTAETWNTEIVTRTERYNTTRRLKIGEVDLRFEELSVHHYQMRLRNGEANCVSPRIYLRTFCLLILGHNRLNGIEDSVPYQPINVPYL